jgi:peptidoglycan hydrolase-like protein with peptidoglycan-binding domain
MSATISAPVGMTSKAKNLEPDVRIIQALLDGIKPADGGPSVALAVDGKCGPKTQNAIQQFQFKQVGAKLADGRVDPGGPTLAKMNALSTAAVATLDDTRVVRCHPAPPRKV